MEWPLTNQDSCVTIRKTLGSLGITLKRPLRLPAIKSASTARR